MQMLPFPITTEGSPNPNEVSAQDITVRSAPGALTVERRNRCDWRAYTSFIDCLDRAMRLIQRATEVLTQAGILARLSFVIK